MSGPVTYVEKGHGLHEAIQAAGHWLTQHDGVWLADDPVAVQAIIDAYDYLAVTKAECIAAVNAECQARIYAVWPADKQMSALAGIYGEADRVACLAWIESHIAASNVASDAVTAATTVEQAKAVTVLWPT